MISTSSNMKTRQKKVSIIAIGGGAGKILDFLRQEINPDYMDCIHIDSKENIDNKGPINYLRLKDPQDDEQSYGSDLVEGEKIAQHNLRVIQQCIHNSKGIIVVLACLGGGLASDIIQVLAHNLGDDGNKTVCFVVTMPFSFEGNNCRDIAIRSLEALRLNSKPLVAIQNDFLFKQCSADILVSQAFSTVDKSLADGVLGIAELIRTPGIIPISLNSLGNVLRPENTFCSVATVKAYGANQAFKIVEALFHSQMLGGEAMLKSADVIVANLVGDKNNLQLGELRQCLQTLQEKLSLKSKTLMGANLVETYDRSIQLTLLAIHYYKDRKRGYTSDQKESQSELPFKEESACLGIFAGTGPTLYNGENLDIPSFIRHNVSID